MPLTRQTAPDGSMVFHRGAFKPADYTVSPDVIKTIKSWSHMNIHELLEDREGPLNGRYAIVDRYTRDGKKWLILQHGQGEWCVEVEDSDRAIAHTLIRPLPPERAWGLRARRGRQGNYPRGALLRELSCCLGIDLFVFGHGHASINAP